MSLLDRPPPQPPRPPQASQPDSEESGARVLRYPANREANREADSDKNSEKSEVSAKPVLPPPPPPEPVEHQPDIKPDHPGGQWTTSLPAGTILAGKYRVERMLGVGGMGAVIAATHIDLQEIRAVKVMHAAHTDNALAVERFLREARAAVKLKSEHVAKVFDVGRLDTGVPYIVMEYLQGSDLSRLARKRGTLPVAEVVRYVLQVCDAIAEAHALGIVHRDLKPANLYLTKRDDGSPSIKVLDFGISKLTGQGSMPDLEITTAKDVLGSPHYMSPEQMRSTRNADERSDIWALGVIMYRLMTGKLPFPADTTMELATRVLETVPEPPSALRPEVPKELEAVILHCLEKDPDKRIASAAELAAGLLPFAPPDALEILPMSRRLARSIAPGRASFASVSDASGLGAPPVPVELLSAPAAGPPVEEANAPAEQPLPERVPPRNGLMILGAIGALTLGIGSVVAVSWHRIAGTPAPTAPVATSIAAPVVTAAPTSTATVTPTAAPADTAAPEDTAAPAETAAPEDTATPADTAAPSASARAATTSSSRPIAPASTGGRTFGTSDPFGRSRK